MLVLCFSVTPIAEELEFYLFASLFLLSHAHSILFPCLFCRFWLWPYFSWNFIYFIFSSVGMEIEMGFSIKAETCFCRLCGSVISPVPLYKTGIRTSCLLEALDLSFFILLFLKKLSFSLFLQMLYSELIFCFTSLFFCIQSGVYSRCKSLLFNNYFSSRI